MSSERKRSTAEELSEREEYAARLLDEGMTRSFVVLALVKKYKVSRRQAQRYVNVAGLEVVGDALQLPQLDAALGLSIRRLDLLREKALQQDDLKLVEKIEKTIAGIVNQRIRTTEMIAVRRAEWLA